MSLPRLRRRLASCVHVSSHTHQALSEVDKFRPKLGLPPSSTRCAPAGRPRAGYHPRAASCWRAPEALPSLRRMLDGRGRCRMQGAITSNSAARTTSPFCCVRFHMLIARRAPAGEAPSPSPSFRAPARRCGLLTWQNVAKRLLPTSATADGCALTSGELFTGDEIA